MIRSIAHRGLRRLYRRGDESRIPPELREKSKHVLACLEVASRPGGIAIAGLDIHPLRGDLAGHWAVSVSGNWRITFRFQGGDVWDVDLVDYH